MDTWSCSIPGTVGTETSKLQINIKLDRFITFTPIWMYMAIWRTTNIYRSLFRVYTKAMIIMRLFIYIHTHSLDNCTWVRSTTKFGNPSWSCATQDTPGVLSIRRGPAPLRIPPVCCQSPWVVYILGLFINLLFINLLFVYLIFNFTICSQSNYVFILFTTSCRVIVLRYIISSMMLGPWYWDFGVINSLREEYAYHVLQGVPWICIVTRLSRHSWNTTAFPLQE